MTVAPTKGNPTTPVAYVILHQAPSGPAADEYLRTIREFHRRVAGEYSTLREVVRKATAETVAREAQVLYGELSQFLVTPLKSDQADVRKTIEEALTRVSTAGPSGQFGGLLRTLLFRVIPSHHDDPALAELLAAGSAYLRQLKFKDAGDLYESTFLVDGAGGLDTLEHIVRDRLGISEGAHGRHVGQTTGWTFSAYNMVRGDLPSGPNAVYDARLYLDKPRGMLYDVFRQGMEQCLASVNGGAEDATSALWQRKLGFGPGREFICRIACSEFSATKAAVNKWITEYRRIFPHQTSPETPCLILSEGIGLS